MVHDGSFRAPSRTANPDAYFSTNSTRRFLARPTSVRLAATGASGPDTSALQSLRVDVVLGHKGLHDSLRAFLLRQIEVVPGQPTLSVWPTMNTFREASCDNSFAISFTTESDSGLMVALSVSK